MILKQRLTLSIQTMLNDLEEIKEAFFTEKYRKERRNNIDITHAQVGTEIYESMLTSGLFTYLGKSTQTEIGNLYFSIKYHNRYLFEKTRYTIENELGYGTKQTYSNIDDAIGELVTRYESNIKKTLPKAQSCLKEELEKVSKPKSKSIPKRIQTFWSCQGNPIESPRSRSNQFPSV